MDLFRYSFIFHTFLFMFISQCVSFKYEIGKSYKYAYETSVVFNQDASSKSTQKDVGFFISSELLLELVLDNGDSQLYQLQILSTEASSVLKPSLKRKLQSLSTYPVLFSISENAVEKLYTAEQDSIFATNFKKGIISLFQVSEVDGTVSEVDVPGECTATYKVSGTSITKTISGCSNIELSGEHRRTNQMLGVTVQPTRSYVYDLSDGLVNTVTGLNKVSAKVNMRPKLRSSVLESQEIKLRQSMASPKLIKASSEEDAVSKISSAIGSNLGMDLLPSILEVQHCTEDCFSPASLVSKNKDVLIAENMASVESAKSFLNMVKGFRNVGKASLEEAFTGKDSYNIVPQLIDIGVATQTESAQQALMDLLNFEDDYNIEYPERYLLAVAFTSHPSETLIKGVLSILKKKIPSPELKESVLLSLGAVVNTFYSVKENRKSTVIDSYVKKVVDGLAGCKSLDENCQLMYIRSLGNAGIPSSLKTLLDYAEDGRTPAAATAALQALRRFNMHDIASKALPVMKRIFYEIGREYDLSVRTSALELLLRLRPSTKDIQNIISVCTPPVDDVEFSTFVLERLQDAIKTDSFLRHTVIDALRDLNFNNYNTFAQKGSSSAVSSFLAVTSDINATYGLYMANSKSGLMKQSSMQVNALGNEFSLPLLNFGLYADGVDSLLGDEEVEQTDGEDAVEPTSGMSLTIMDVLLRPIEFFRGSSGLMSAVWNAPSDPISALQGNLLLQDHSERIHLSNGLIVSLQIMGATSIDLSGSVSISLWNRNCHSAVINSGALFIEGRMKLESEELQGGITFSAEGASSIHFTTDVDFYEMPLKMCLQMSRPSFTFRENYTKFEKHKLLKTTLRVKKVSESSINEESYILHKYNARQCRNMDIEE